MQACLAVCLLSLQPAWVEELRPAEPQPWLSPQRSRSPSSLATGLGALLAAANSGATIGVAWAPPAGMTPVRGDSPGGPQRHRERPRYF